MSSKFFVCLLLLQLSVPLFCGSASAQSVYGEISGRFTDFSGAPIEKAEVTVISVEKGWRVKTTTNHGGYYALVELVPDTYNVRAAKDGYKTVEAVVIPVSADQTSILNGKMPRGNATEIVPAIGDVNILKTDRTDVSTLFTSRAIDSLPLLNLNSARFELLVPGALPTLTSFAPQQNPQGGPAINVNGQHFSGTASQLDGTDNRDPLQGLIVINPTLESVKEMKVTTQNYSAEFGEATAGVLTIQTRSGTNSWHGSVFDYRRTDWGQATQPFAFGGVVPTRRNEFGGSLGGPLVANKLFFFGDYQGTRQSVGFNQLLSVPTALVHQTCVGPGVANGPAKCDLSQYPFSIHDPNNHTQFVGNLIPNDVTPGSSSISLAAVNLLNVLPLPNLGNQGDIVNNFVASGAEIYNADQFNVRTDYNATAKLKLLGRYSFADFRDDGSSAFGTVAGGAGTNPSGFAGIGRTRNQGLSTGFAYSLSPSLLTDFRFGFFRYHLNLDSPDLGTTPAVTIAQTPGLNNDLFSSGMPDFEIPVPLPGQAPNPATGGDYLRFGYSPQVNSCGCPVRESEQQFQWVSNWIRTAGNHQFKWGADIRYIQNYRLSGERRRAGHLTFRPNATSSSTGEGGLGLATFLLGDVTFFERFYANPNNPASLEAGERQKRWFFYGQDTWRATPRLTVNYGLRWEVYFPQTVTGTGAGGFLVPNFSNPFEGSVFNVPGTAGVNSNGNIENSLKNLGPRVGIAYLMAPKTVIRAGYGRSFDVGFAGSIFGIAKTQNPPVMAFVQNFHQNDVVFHLGQSAPAFIFPSLTTSFSISDLYSALNPAVSPFNQAIVYAVPGKMRLPTVDAWNFTVQHELSSTSYFELGYVGNKGTHVFTDGNDRTSYYDLNQLRVEGFNSDPKPSRRRFDKWPTPVRYFGNDASNNYNSLQAKVNKIFRHGYEFLAHYTWAKGFDYDNVYFNVDPALPRTGYGRSNFDRTHAFVLTNLWSLPVGRGKPLLGEIGNVTDRIIGGWSINAITAWYSGLPFTPSYSSCVEDRDTGPCRPNLVGAVHISGSRNGYFTTTGGVPLQPSATPGNTIGPWQRPASGTFGSAGRNSLSGPGFFESDVAVAKEIAFTERVSLRFRADVFNAFNKVNLGKPDPCVDCGKGGTITSLDPGASPREFQFSLKLQF